MTKPPSRHHVHRRSITLDGFVRDDGLIEVEAELKDTKTYGFPSVDRGYIQPGEAIHHMQVRIAVDDQLEVREAEAKTLAGPYHICPSANDVFDQLIGLRIASGWRNKVRHAIGGRRGCTHITELMGPVATVVMQTFYGEEARRKRDNATGDMDMTDSDSYIGLINSCVGYDEDSPVITRLWPNGIPKKEEKPSNS